MGEATVCMFECPVRISLIFLGIIVLLALDLQFEGEGVIVSTYRFAIGVLCRVLDYHNK
jgi:hypothetical protein